MSWTYEEREEHERGLAIIEQLNKENPRTYKLYEEISFTGLTYTIKARLDHSYYEPDFLMPFETIGRIKVSIEEENNKKYLYFHDLMVNYDFTNEGIATKLVNKALEVANRILEEFKIANEGVNDSQQYFDFVVNCNDKSKSIFTKAGFEFVETYHILKVSNEINDGFDF